MCVEHQTCCVDIPALLPKQDQVLPVLRRTRSDSDSLVYVLPVGARGQSLCV